MEFIYEDRDDVLQSYRNGTLQTVAKRLQQVNVSANGQLVRHYKVGYETFDGVTFADPIKTSRINKIEKCFISANDCETAINLSWTSTAADRYALGDIHEGAYTNWWETPVAKATTQNHYADIDGDGYLDLVNIYPSPLEPVTVKFGIENMTDGNVDHSYYQNLVAQLSTQVTTVTDIYYTETWYYDGHLTNGNGSTTRKSKAATGVMDFNGDGKMDIFVTDDKQLRGVQVYLSNGRTFTHSSTFSIPASTVTFNGDLKVGKDDSDRAVELQA